MANKILVVDDSKTYLAYANAVLKDAGFDVISASDIWISRIVNTEKPDLILMDVMLGSSNGTTAVSAIKKWNLGESVRIYLHSAQSAEKLSDLAHQCGADGYIVKDGVEGSLLKSIQKAMNTAIHHSVGLH